jgi:serine/threonine protein phosphatase PrpC
MQHILMVERDLDRCVERLITAANEEGGIDNISVVLARFEPT